MYRGSAVAVVVVCLLGDGALLHHNLSSIARAVPPLKLATATHIAISLDICHSESMASHCTCFGLTDNSTWTMTLLLRALRQEYVGCQ